MRFSLLFVVRMFLWVNSCCFFFSSVCLKTPLLCLLRYLFFFAFTVHLLSCIFLLWLFRLASLSFSVFLSFLNRLPLTLFPHFFLSSSLHSFFPPSPPPVIICCLWFSFRCNSSSFSPLSVSDQWVSSPGGVVCTREYRSETPSAPSQETNNQYYEGNARTNVISSERVYRNLTRVVTNISPHLSYESWTFWQFYKQTKKL